MSDEEIAELKEQLASMTQEVIELRESNSQYAHKVGNLQMSLDRAKSFLRELSIAQSVNGKIQFGWSVNAKHLLKEI